MESRNTPPLDKQQDIILSCQKILSKILNNNVQDLMNLSATAYQDVETGYKRGGISVI